MPKTGVIRLRVEARNRLAELDKRGDFVEWIFNEGKIL
jgi:hypothetical protein